MLLETWIEWITPGLTPQNVPYSRGQKQGTDLHVCNHACTASVSNCPLRRFVRLRTYLDCRYDQALAFIMGPNSICHRWKSETEWEYLQIMYLSRSPILEHGMYPLQLSYTAVFN